MAIKGRETVSRLVEEYTEYAETLHHEALQHYLEHVFAEVIRGEHTAKTEEELESESQDAGIERQNYGALVNLTAHAADGGSTA